MVSLRELKQRCPPSVLKLQQFLEKRKEYVNRPLRLEESTARGQLPPIAWDFYNRNVRSEAMSLVEEFERKYTSLTVPYPVDNYTRVLEQLKEQVKDDLEEFECLSNFCIEGYRKEMEGIRNPPPFNLRTWEEYIDDYPEVAQNLLEKPTFWAHDPSEQMGFVEEDELEDVSMAHSRDYEESQGEVDGMEAELELSMSGHGFDDFSLFNGIRIK